MATAWNSHQEAQKLITRVTKHFGNISRTRYWLVITSYEPFHGYNIFFNIARPKMFTRSIPVGEYRNCSFAQLLKLLTEFGKSYHFTMDFRGFSKEELHQLLKTKKYP